MSISQVTWPALGQLDISDEILESSSIGARRSPPLYMRADQGQGGTGKQSAASVMTTVRDDDERSRRDDVSQNCPRRGEFDRPVSEKTAG